MCVLRISEPPWHHLRTTGLFPSVVAITPTTIKEAAYQVLIALELPQGCAYHDQPGIAGVAQTPNGRPL